MANDVNSVVIVGRLVRDCEIRVVSSGTTVCRFSVAVNRRKKSGDTWTDEVNYFDVVLFGKVVDSLKTYLTKGRQVAIEGELRQNRWEQDGQTRSKVEIYANNIQLVGSTGGSGSGSGSGYSQGSAVNGNYAAQDDNQMGPEAFEDHNNSDEDIPF